MIDSLTTPSEKNFIIYRSSAGSGKTYTLAREYILLALQYPSYFRSILAVTFTNKATAEMKKRIIENLDELRNGGGKGLRVEIRDALALTDAQLSEKARQSLEAILHDYSHFAVSTIDKFFQRILRAFAREVGIQGGVTLEMDQNKVLEAIIDKMLTEVGEKARLTGWLTEFAEQKLQEGKSWDIRRDIRSLGKELFKERFKVVAPVLEKVAEDEATIQHVLKGMHELRAMFENAVQGYISTFEKLMEQYGLELSQFSRGGSGPAGLFGKFAKKEYEITDKRREAAEVLDHWITKTAQNRPELERALEGGILQAYNGLIEYHDRYITQYCTAEQIMRYLYTLGIMADLSRKLAGYRDEEEVMMISDAPDFLKRIIGDNETPYVYEKAGSFYRHYLIDEFQDTSGFQWENFRPLVKNSLDQGLKNLVVGDVKQSIYRWRGGDLKLLLEQVQSDIGDAYTDARNLEFNWRSCANIINFNNKLFELSPALLGGLLEEDADGIIDPALKQSVLQDLVRLKNAYHEATQKQGNENKLGGLVQLQWLEAGKDDASDEEDEMTWQEQAIQKTIETIEQLQDANYALKDICILVRKTDEGRQVAKALLEKKEASQSKYRYDVISPESLYLASSPVVRLLLSAFHYLYNPADTLSRAQLAYEYHHFLLGKESPVVSDLFLWSGNREKVAEFEALLPPDFLSQKESLLRVPLLELTEMLINLFGLTTYTREYPYLQGFQDALLEYSKNFRGDVGSFLEWWEETGSRRSIQVPEELDAIRVMTIHKAKGLEFKTLVVPFCCWELDHKLEEILWCPAPAEKPFDKLPFYPVRYSSKLAQTYFSEAYYKEKLQIYLDNLNLLYVAFTRAEEALYAFAPKPRFNKNGSYKKNKVSDLLYCLLMEQNGEPFELEPAPYINPDEASVVIGNVPSYSNEKIPETSSVKLQNYLSTNWRQRLSIRLRGGTLDPEQREKSLISTRRGTIYHRILSQIRLLEDLPAVLSSVLPFESLEPEEQQAVKSQLEKLFALPDMQRWYGAGWEVKTESPVLPTGGDIRRFDRVLLKGEEAILLEFKTGLPSPGHVQQATEYVDLLSEMGYPKVSGYLVYIDGLTIQQVA